MSVAIRSAALLPLPLAIGRPVTSDYFLTTATAGRMTTGMAYTYSTLSICFRGLSGRRKLCPCAPNGAGSRELPLLRLLLPWSPCSSARQRGQAQRRVMIPVIPIRLIPLTPIRRHHRRPRALPDILRRRRIHGVAAEAQAGCGTRVGDGGARAGRRLDGAGPAGGGAGVGPSGSPSVGAGAAGGVAAAAGTAVFTVASMAGLPMPASTATALAVASTAAAFTISQHNTAIHD
jgi:hypothetical protein